MHPSLLIALVALLAVAYGLNTRPIFGVVAQAEPSDSKWKGQNYFAASYSKFLEAAGARTVPIMPNLNATELRYYYEALNGVIFPGGSSSIGPGSRLYNTAKQLVAWMKEDVDAGGYFVIIGHCLGFELLGTVISEDAKALGFFDADAALHLNFTSSAPSSRMFSGAPASVMTTLSTKSVTVNHHERGFSPNTLRDNKQLASFFRVLSTNYDEHGREFVSTMEGIKYPLYALQWHAEKPQFEWTTSVDFIPHDADAIEAMQYVANFYISEGRKSSHKFASEEEEKKSLLYNWAPYYTDDYFVQEYIFPN